MSTNSALELEEAQYNSEDEDLEPRKKRRRNVKEKSSVNAGKFKTMAYNYTRCLGNMTIRFERPGCLPDLDVQWSGEAVGSTQMTKEARELFNALFHMLTPDQISYFLQRVSPLALSK